MYSEYHDVFVEKTITPMNITLQKLDISQLKLADVRAMIDS